ncbi:MAG: rhodanese-like domain-containing protein [Magnetococcales bacterium]|nr:rhodanese-like domain-containing protein [Magnetococcales bacterium]NGZ04986.1 rhodanese-like domain-containing protein [Magnetococcales bacterium]
MDRFRWVTPILVFLSFWMVWSAQEVCAGPVNITREMAKFTVQHGKQQVTVTRNQDTRAVIEADFAKISRNCPPFCIQPHVAAPGVETIGELELIRFMTDEVNKGIGLLIDARTPDWHAQGVIPGSINIPYSEITPSLGANALEIENALKRVGATPTAGGGWDYSKAKRLAIWCNGPWCGQSHAAIAGLLELKYPADKILYYRGGMQMWKLFGLTVVPPAEDK